MAVVVGVACSKHSDSGTRAIPGGTSLSDISRSGPSDAFTHATKVPGVELVATGVTGPNGDLVLIDPEGRTMRETPSNVVELAPGHKKGQLLVLDLVSFRLLQAPDLRLVDSIALQPRRDLAPYGSPRHLRRVRTGWCLLAGRGELLEIRSHPFGLGRRASMDMPSAIQCAFDAKTDALVVIGSDGEIRVLDWKTLKPVHRYSMRDTEFYFSVCAHGGTAWIATRRGSFVHYDIANNVVTGETSISSPKGTVELALSASGARLAATSSVFISGSNHPTVLTIWNIGPNSVTRRIRAETKLRTTIWNVGLYEKQEKLFIAGRYPAHIWAYRTTRDP